MAAHASLPAPWDTLPAQLRARGQRWTPQRDAVVRALSSARGHLTGSQLVDLCRATDPSVVPSTVYRTLDALEELGFVRHSHGADGREEYHLGPDASHGHLHCAVCGGQWQIQDDEVDAVSAAFAGRGFAVDASHVTIVGRCRACTAAGN
jgi:Fur family ferric uptake transcriptional regulator